MNQELEDFKTEITAITPIVNSFHSEQVQLKVLEALLKKIQPAAGFTIQTNPEFWTKQHDANVALLPNLSLHNLSEKTKGRKPPGATRIMNKLIAETEYFNTGRTINDIVLYCQIHYHCEFVSAELSGVLLKLCERKKLYRTKDDKKLYRYSTKNHQTEIPLP